MLTAAKLLQSVPVTGPAAALAATATHADVACNGASTGRVGVTVSGGSGALSFNWNTPGNVNTALVNNISCWYSIRLL